MGSIPWSDFQVAKFLATPALPAQMYLALHYTNPAMGGLGSGEVSGGSYLRQALTMSAMSNRAIYNTAAVLFTNLPGVTVAYLGIWDAASGGNLIGYIQVLPTITVQAGGQFPVNAGDVALAF